MPKHSDAKKNRPPPRGTQLDRIELGGMELQGMELRVMESNGAELSGLYTETLPVAIRYACWLCRTRHDREDAARDIVQDAAVVLCTRTGDIPAGDDFLPWFLKVIRNEHNNRQRLRARHGETVLEESDLERWEAVAITPFRGIILMEISQALARLSREEREALELHAFIGLTISQISTIYGCSIRAMGKRVERAQKRLREYLLGDEDAAVPVTFGGDLAEEITRLLDRALAQVPDLQEKTERRGRKPKRSDEEKGSST